MRLQTETQASHSLFKSYGLSCSLPKVYSNKISLVRADCLKAQRVLLVVAGLHAHMWPVNLVSVESAHARQRGESAWREWHAQMWLVKSVESTVLPGWRQCVKTVFWCLSFG